MDHEIEPTPEPAPPVADPSHPDWTPPPGNIIELPDLSGVPVEDGPPEEEP